MHPDLQAMFDQLRTSFPSESEHEVIRTWEQLFEGAGPAGTLKAWMQAHNGRQIDTFQYDRNTLRPWVPGARTLDASRATFFELDGSSRYYAGMAVLAATDSAIAAADSDGWHLCLYYACG